MALNLKVSWLLLALVLIVVILEISQAQTTSRPRRGRNQVRPHRGNSTRTRGGHGRRSNSARGHRRAGAGGRAGGRRRPRGPPPGCEEIYLPMCKGLLPYHHTKLPNAMNHTTQLEVYQSLQYEWSNMDHACSKNLRLMICAKYLPKCRRRGPGMGPCKSLCMKAKAKCAQPLKRQLRVTWGSTYSCKDLPTKKCVKPLRRERQCPAPHPNPVCVSNAPLDICANLTFSQSTMPNMFLQCDIHDINTELNNYQSLVASNCHAHLPFLLCGVYTPYCSQQGQPFLFPCQELCDEVRANCESRYTSLNHGLPWPAKLQCHRLPLSTNENYQCVMPGEGTSSSRSRPNVR